MALSRQEAGLHRFYFCSAPSHATFVPPEGSAPAVSRHQFGLRHRDNARHGIAFEKRSCRVITATSENRSCVRHLTQAPSKGVGKLSAQQSLNRHGAVAGGSAVVAPSVGIGRRSMKEGKMMTAETMRRNADNCLALAEAANDGPGRFRYMRMATAWQDLAEHQEWLNGLGSRAHIESKAA